VASVCPQMVARSRVEEKAFTQTTYDFAIA
jgi:hypothetical protein